ncbi:oxidoreductase, partial [Neorhizobium sp. SHOUNA12B]|nr:oxidoreductase [Neorhizobium sp. SHOUNA12B]
GGADLPGTVLPHILRAVTLIGVDSVIATREQRLSAWARLARDLDPAKLSEITTTEPMSNLPQLAEDIIAGKIRGRVVIDVTK